MEMNFNLDQIRSEPQTPRGLGKDAKRVAQRLDGFQTEKSEAYLVITRRFSKNLRQSDLIRIAEILAVNKGLCLDRDAKRNKHVIFKWFHENWAKIHDEIYKIIPLDENFNVIDCNAVSKKKPQTE